MRETTMEEKREPNAKLLRSTLRNGITQLLAVAVCTGVLFLFVALTYSRITLPAYTANYDQKDTQQVVNLLITVVATVIGILLSHCRRLTNEAETRSELRNEELTIPRLHVHFEAAGGSKAAMSFPAVHNKDVWYLVLVYLFTMIIFGFLHSVLSVIFVVEGITSDQGVEKAIHTIPLSVDIPFDHDPCRLQISAPGCTYELALNSLASLLVTIAPFTVAGVTFEPPNGTMGMPYHAIKHFAEQVAASPFEEEHRRYCLPVMDPHIIRCTEEPFNQSTGETESNLVRYTKLDVYANTTAGTRHHLDDDGMYRISSPYPPNNRGDIKFRTNDEGQGVFLTRAQWTPDYYALNTSVITGANNGYVGYLGTESSDRKIGYGSLLYRMMYGKDPGPDVLAAVPANSSFAFVAKCEFPEIAEAGSYSSWKQVDFTLKNGVLRSNVTEERCANPRAPLSGYGDLFFTLEGGASILASSDGYSKLFNENVAVGSVGGGSGSSIFDGMSHLDATVNKMYHLTQTSYTQTIYEYALQNPNVSAFPIIMTDYPHRYVISITWTPTTYIGLALALLITLNAYVLVGRWVRAVYRFGFDSETWNLLRPIELIAYSLAAWQELMPELRTVDQRRLALRGDTTTVLREHPGWHPTHSPQSPQSPISTAVAGSPGSYLDAKMWSPVGGEGRPGITIETKEQDVERGTP